MRRLPHQGARHGTVDHGDASNGVFLLLHLWVLLSSWTILVPNDLPPPLSSLWMASRANGSLSCEWRCLQQLTVEGSFVQEKGERTNPRSGPGRSAWADRPGSVTPSLPWVLMYLWTLRPPLAPFWRCHPCIQDGGSPCVKSGLLPFNPQGCSFVTLQSMTPLGVISSSS
jgi:hypothetical protein